MGKWGAERAWVRVPLGAVAIVGGLMASSPLASGQQLYAAGLTGVVETLRRGGTIYTVSTVSGDEDERCAVDEDVLAAEAERTLRRGGLAARPLSRPSDQRVGVLLFVKGISIHTRMGTCATFLDIQLTLRGEVGLVVLAAEGGHLTTWNGPDQVDRIRAFVEANVSVVANAIRSASEELPRSIR